jgi:ATP-binding protein involved in chromosome partitioning
MIIKDDSRHIIWRGPLIVKMLGDFFENTDWGELDYLIIDLPPGTSDAPLTIMQVLELDGFVIVTTPQRIAAINSIRSGLMAKKLNVALLGIIENMSDGNVSGNTKDASVALDTNMLGLIKFDGSFNTYSDLGKIPVLESKEIAEIFDKIVTNILKE